MNKITRVTCQQCGKIRNVKAKGMKAETYLKQSPFCRHCSALNVKDKISKGWFQKGFKPWNTGLTKKDERVKKYAIKISLKQKGKHLSLRTEFKKGENQDKKNINWRGNNVGYYALHTWVIRKLGKASICHKCGSDKKVQWANKSWEYKRDINDWIELCFKCHRIYDMQNWGAGSIKFPELRRIKICV